MTEIRSTSSTGGQKGVKLERHDLIPVRSLEALALHFGRGARKYEDHQWRKGYEWSKSYSAMQRHLTAFWSGEDFDACPLDGEGCLQVKDGEAWVPEEGISVRTCWNHTGSLHITCVAWHSFVLMEFFDRHRNHDDRYIPDRPQDGTAIYQWGKSEPVAFIPEETRLKANPPLTNETKKVDPS